MRKTRILIVLIFCWFSTAGHAQNAVTIQSGDVDGLIAAVEQANASNGVTTILLAEGPGGEAPVFQFEAPYNNSENALPEITRSVEFRLANPAGPMAIFEPAGGAKGGAASMNMRFANVTQGRVVFQSAVIRNFNFQGHGAGIRVANSAALQLLTVLMFANIAGGNGGGVYATDRAAVTLNGSWISGNRATTGAGLSIETLATADIRYSFFLANEATVFGCAINVESGGDLQSGFAVFLAYSTIAAACANVLVENPVGGIVIYAVIMIGFGDGIDSTERVLLGSVILALIPNSAKGEKAVCNDFGVGQITSIGNNISTEDSCNLTDSSDQPNTDPMVDPPDETGVARLRPGSPAVDSARSEVASAIASLSGLPCGYKDSRGLGRPQDANGDGEFECDIGNYEVQGGPDIGPPQSAAFFDTSRNGEGIFVELIGNDLAFVAMFTYTVGAGEPAWFVGIGRVVGNSIVLDDMLQPLGGEFGAGFDPASIERRRVGAMSVNFPTCDAQAQPGKLAFEADSAGGFRDLLVNASRLTSIIDCSGTVGAQSGRSGSFYDPSRDGEGIFVQWLSDGRALVIWYTFDPQGNQFWTISSDVTVNGNTLTANMIYPATGTSFGGSFDPDAIAFQDWGTVTLVYQPGCNGVTFNYDSMVSGFGSGSYNYSRLTSLDGASCDL